MVVIEVTEDMIGNPYNFDGYFRQEKLFDISELGAIQSIVVYFEQASGSFYDVNGKVYFGELTFFHWGGFVPFEPQIWDKKLGAMIDLSKVRQSLNL